MVTSTDMGLMSSRGTPAREHGYMCKCRVTHNFFVHSVDRHFVYDGDDDAFRQRYAKDWTAVGKGAVSLEEVLAEVRTQRADRLQAPADALARVERIEREYVRLHPTVYTLDPPAFLAKGFCDLVAGFRNCGTRPSEVAACTELLARRGLVSEVRPGLWTLEVFTEAFCDLLEAELAHFSASGLPRTAPNTMNRHGIILKELGFGSGLLDPLVYEYINALAGRLLLQFTEELDSYRAFTVLYEAAPDGDQQLAMHYDNSEVTLNVNIGGAWEGGQVAFYGLATDRSSPRDESANVTLRRGHGVIHAGLDLHMALPVTSGRRHNLILWCRSSGVRNDMCPMCFGRPAVVETNGYFDEGFTAPPRRRGFPAAGGPDDDLYA
mmetsp:Transcript_111810/g.316573  ORF Transcript_111810/g.316573 Transcript_111810/m.316573 type:complete len:379 (+) Transcript_111810:57-1193(+)